MKGVSKPPFPPVAAAASTVAARSRAGTLAALDPVGRDVAVAAGAAVPVGPGIFPAADTFTRVPALALVGEVAALLVEVDPSPGAATRRVAVGFGAGTAVGFAAKGTGDDVDDSAGDVATAEADAGTVTWASVATMATTRPPAQRPAGPEPRPLDILNHRA